MPPKKKNNKSLNDCLYVGPNLNPNLLDIIINFRKFNTAFCTNIEKAFLQITVITGNFCCLIMMQKTYSKF